MAASYTRKQVVTCVSIVVTTRPSQDLVNMLSQLVPRIHYCSSCVCSISIVLEFSPLTTFRYASSRATGLSIPIPRILSGFATALPLVAGLLLEGGYDLNRRQERRQRAPKGTTPRPPLVIVANTLIFIYSTVVITLLGTHVAPVSNLRCGLDEGWKHMFSTKDTAIKDIQDALNCCGLVNSHDRAWPFPDKTHDQHACEKQFERTTGCLVPWRQEEQRVAGILMAVVGMVFVWQVRRLVSLA